MRIGISGLGFGTHLMHTALTRDDCVVAGVTDFAPERMAAASAQGIATFATPAEMVAGAGLDAMVFASTPHVRGDAFDAAFGAGLPVFVEKPIAGTVAQAEALVARAAGQRVMVGFSFRFHAPVQRLLAADLGRPMLANGEYMFDWLVPAENWLWDPQKGGGFFTENSCHLFDVACALLGEPVRAYAEPVEDDRRNTATGAAVTLAFDTGARAALTLGCIATGGIRDFPRLDIAYENGQAKLEGREHMWTGLRMVRRGQGVETMGADPETLGRTRYSDAFDHFLAAVRDGTPFAATLEDGLRAVRIADAIYRSIASGRAEEI